MDNKVFNYMVLGTTGSAALTLGKVRPPPAHSHSTNQLNKLINQLRNDAFSYIR